MHVRFEFLAADRIPRVLQNSRSTVDVTGKFITRSPLFPFARTLNSHAYLIRRDRTKQFTAARFSLTHRARPCHASAELARLTGLNEP